ncbi:MSMEG_0567/Sll0786 family nitrogen starvation N-acetyltransferase [Pseudonocardia hispaniensis]|uniref:MSMEG_0567/Sll0786 family nitrogen starvation N-acetyltransferase n=1 Tax=Pseudonocardia hispaniensis TaxID=904933 RepID=A0ABW1J724_9PSEU
MTAAPATTASCVLVRDSADLTAHHQIRNAVFVDEQGVFAESDADIRDLDPRTLHVLGLVDGVPAGAVRLYPLDDSDGLWQGDRLAVLREFRAVGLGAPLVRFAVATATAHGGRCMVAHVQPPNETFFRRLGWVRRGAPEIYVGRPHLLMDIDLRQASQGGGGCSGSGSPGTGSGRSGVTGSPPVQ